MLTVYVPKLWIKLISTKLQVSFVCILLGFLSFQGNQLMIYDLGKKKYFSMRNKSNVREINGSQDYQLLQDINFSEIIYQIGSTKLEHIAVFKPLCIDTELNIAFGFSNNTDCVRLRSEGNDYGINCTSAQKAFRLRSLYDIVKDRKSPEWIQQNQLNIKWIPGVTILQQLTDDCSNVAHYTRKILCLHHLIENIHSYTSPDESLKNVLIVLRERILPQFENPSSFNKYHTGFLSSVIHPHSYELGSAVQFLKKVEMHPHEIAIHLLQNFSVSQDHKYKPSSKYLCLKNAIIPTLLARQFFIDHYHTKTKSALPDKGKQVPVDIPTDSIRFREKVAAYFYGEREILNGKKRMVFLHRSGTKRVFTPKSEKLVVQLLKDICKENDFSFEIADFSHKSFNEQYEVMRDASVAIGIHGANLVNTMFMPPSSVLVEINPFGFHHELMYTNGGNSGLIYFSYSILIGSRYSEDGNYSSVDDCIRQNLLCLRFYRDAPLEVLSDDYRNLRILVKKAIESVSSIG